MQMKIEGWLNDAEGSLLLKVSGEDRPNIIAEVAGKLEEQRLYVASITFGLTLVLTASNTSPPTFSK